MQAARADCTLALTKIPKAPSTSLWRKSPLPSQRNIIMLLPGVLELLVPQHGERARKPPSRRVRQDHLVDIAPFGGHERRQEARLVFLGALGDLVRIVHVGAKNNLDR